jgi:hypothetical protein
MTEYQEPVKQDTSEPPPRERAPRDSPEPTGDLDLTMPFTARTLRNMRRKGRVIE